MRIVKIFKPHNIIGMTIWFENPRSVWTAYRQFRTSGIVKAMVKGNELILDNNLFPYPYYFDMETLLYLLDDRRDLLRKFDCTEGLYRVHKEITQVEDS